MPRAVDTAETERLLHTGAQVVEVLPQSDYEREHLPGARSIPLASMQPDTVAELDRDSTTIVYCFDYQCDLSARAARRLETLGFTDVCDYTASKAAWMACGLPVEGTVRSSTRAGAIARTTILRCSLGEKVGDLRDRFGDETVCVVLDDDGIVLGAVRRGGHAARRHHPRRRRPATGTADGPPEHHRPRSSPAAWIATGGRTCYVTTVEGRLLGLVDASGPPWSALTPSATPTGCSSATGCRARSTAPASSWRTPPPPRPYGFGTAMLSDHFHPWVPQQGNSPFAWAVLGGIADRTVKLRVGTGVQRARSTRAPARRRACRLDRRDDDAGPLLPRSRQRRAAQRAGDRRPLAPAQGAPGAAGGGCRDHPEAVGGKVGDARRRALPGRAGPAVHPPRHAAADRDRRRREEDGPSSPASWPTG